MVNHCICREVSSAFRLVDEIVDSYSNSLYYYVPISLRLPASNRFRTLLPARLLLMLLLSYHSDLTPSSLAKKRTHRAPTPLTFLHTKSWQPFNLHLHNLISVQPPRSTRCSLLVTLARSPTSSWLRITDRSFWYASGCLWNQLPSSLRQPHSSLSVSDLIACCCSYHISLCQLINLAIYNSYTLSFPAQNVPLSQIFPTIGSLPTSGLTSYYTDLLQWTFLLSSFVFLMFFIKLSSLHFFGSVRKIKLAIREHLGVQKYSYRMVWYRILFSQKSHYPSWSVPGKHTTQLNSTQRASMDAGVKTPQCPHLSRHYFISIL